MKLLNFEYARIMQGGLQRREVGSICIAAIGIDITTHEPRTEVSVRACHVTSKSQGFMLVPHYCCCISCMFAC